MTCVQGMNFRMLWAYPRLFVREVPLGFHHKGFLYYSVSTNVLFDSSFRQCLLDNRPKYCKSYIHGKLSK